MTAYCKWTRRLAWTSGFSLLPDSYSRAMIVCVPLAKPRLPAVDSSLAQHPHGNATLRSLLAFSSLLQPWKKRGTDRRQRHLARQQEEHHKLVADRVGGQQAANEEETPNRPLDCHLVVGESHLATA